VRTFKVKAFARWARREGIADSILSDTVSEMRKGLVDAELGGGVCKKRIPTSSRGKRGGGRTIVAFRNDKHTFFLFGFLKNERSTIDTKEMAAFKKYAQYLFGLKDEQLVKLLSEEELLEVK
jgi:hypothetical protein